jgi:hypothetical protein
MIEQLTASLVQANMLFLWAGLPYLFWYICVVKGKAHSLSVALACLLFGWALWGLSVVYLIVKDRQ